MKHIYSVLVSAVVAFVLVGCSQDSSETAADKGILGNGLDKMGSSLESVTDATGDVVDGAVDAVEGAAEKAGEMANDAMASAKDVANDVSDSVSDMAAVADDKLSGAASSSLQGDVESADAEAKNALDQMR